MAKGGKGGKGNIMGSINNSSNGGIMNSGIFGMFGTTVVCKADDSSIFCMVSKIVNMIMMIGFLILVLYVIYMVFKFFTNRPQQMTGGYVVGSKYRSKLSRRIRSKYYV